MYEKFQANWVEMGLKVLKDDFMMWYRPIVKKGSQFLKRIGDEDEEWGVGKDKGCAEAEEEDEEEHSNGEPGEKQDENLGEEQPSPLKLRIPCKKRSTSKSSSKKPEDPIVALRSRVEELESELVEEQANTNHINECRLHQKERCRMSKTKLLAAEEEVEKLTAEAMKLAELKEREKQEILEDNEKLKLESEGFEREREVFQRQREEYERLKDSELHREELVEELTEVGKKWEVCRAELSEKIRLVEQELVTRQEEWRVQMQDMEKSRSALQDRVRELELEASVFVRGGRVCPRSRAVVLVRAVVFVHGGGSRPGRSSFVCGGRRRPRCRLWAPRCRAWVVGLVRGRCTSFVAGGLMFMGCGCRTRVG